MQWIVGHRPKLLLIVIYIRYWSAIDSLQWNVESSSKLNFERASTPMSLNGLRSKLISHDDTVYEGWIDSRFTLVHKGILVIIQDCLGDNKQGL